MDDHAPVLQAAERHCAERGDQLLLLLRPRAGLCCSVVTAFPPLGPDSQQARFVMVYAQGAGRLLTAGIAFVRDVLEAQAQGVTLDPPAGSPVSLGGALVLPIEVGTLAAELLRPSPRHALMLRRTTGQLVRAWPARAGDGLVEIAADARLGFGPSPSLGAIKAISSASTGVLRKLQAQSQGRTRHKGKVSAATRRQHARGASEPTAAKLLAVLPTEDVLAHIDMLTNWSQELIRMAGAPPAAPAEARLQSIRQGLCAAVEAAAPGAAPSEQTAEVTPPPTLSALFAQWNELLQQLSAAASACVPNTTTEKSLALQRQQAVAGWLAGVRTATFQAAVAAAQRLPPTPLQPPIDRSPALQEILQVLDPKAVLTEDTTMVFAIRSGSAMYNLATASSDEDYLLVYATPPRHLLKLERERPSEEVEFKAELPAGGFGSFGSDKSEVVEGSALELSRYLALLCKGNPKLLEPLFLREGDGAVPLQSSWIWAELCQMRERCLRTQRCATQFVGFVADRLHKAARALTQQGGDLKAAKYLYHALHKLSQLRCIIRQEPPSVWLPAGSPDHTRIMRIRTLAEQGRAAGQEAAGGLSLADEVTLATADLTAAKGELAEVLLTLPLEVDFAALSSWLLSVRYRLAPALAASTSAVEGTETTAGEATAADCGGAEQPLLERQTSASSVTSESSVSAATPTPADDEVSHAQESRQTRVQQLSASTAAADTSVATASGVQDAMMMEEEDEEEDEEELQRRTDYIRTRLAQFQQEEQVRIVFAAERSSRIYGYSHAQSDHDIMCIFLCPQSEYFGLTSTRRAVKREYAAGPDIPEVEIMGWELKHALTLARSSNPTMIETLTSPLVYIDLLPSLSTSAVPVSSWGSQMLGVAMRHYDRRALAKSWLNHAERDFQAIVHRRAACAAQSGRGDDGQKSGGGARQTSVAGAPRKKYLVVLRSLLCADELWRAGALPPFQLAADEEDALTATVWTDEAPCPLPPIDIGVLMARATLGDPESPLLRHGGAALAVVEGFLSPASRQQGLLRLPMQEGCSAELAIETCCREYIERLEQVVTAALPPRMWERVEPAQREAERAAKARRDRGADSAWGEMCVAILTTETASFV
jgi:predicted nucleotidyltransferase